MVECGSGLDSIFNSLSDPTRRDILSRLAEAPLTISEIASPYSLTFAAISKHLMVLEKSGLVTKTRQGKQQIVRISPLALKTAESYLQRYEELWQSRLDSLNNYLRKEQKRWPKTRKW